MSRSRRSWIAIPACLFAVVAVPLQAQAKDLSTESVLKAIEQAQQFLVSKQNADGSWPPVEGGRYQLGVTCLVTLALIDSGMTVEDRPVANALTYLRKQPLPKMTYEVSLMIMALADAKDGNRDIGRITALAQKLENGQSRAGENTGLWSYSTEEGGLLNLGGDRSNGQFAVLGLRAAAYAGVPINRQTWERTHRHWVTQQNADGGWSYSGGDNRSSTGSMTVAGISTLVTTTYMLRDDWSEAGPDGTPNCCPQRQEDDSLERAMRWMKDHFTVRSNPGAQMWLLYYLYGMERAGRLSGRRFFGQHDWYREGAQLLIDRQRGGSWVGQRGPDADPVVSTSFGLLFLSKGLAPVLINKLKYGRPDPAKPGELVSDDWNNHGDDVRNLTELIGGLPKWPKLLNWQVIDVHQVQGPAGVRDLLQSPILYLSGQQAPQLTAEQVALLREYVNQGGFIFAVANCQRVAFEEGFRDLVRQMYPDGEAELKRLTAEHPIFRSEYLLPADTVELYGADVGCRTAIVYAPEDLSCFWDQWRPKRPPDNAPEGVKNLWERIGRSTRIGVNVVAYATGREPPRPLDNDVKIDSEGAEDRIERGLLQIAKLRHGGSWDAAPQALRNLLVGLNRAVGTAASTRPKDLPASDPNIFKYPLLYMHGRNSFELGARERDQLKEYLNRGGVLFADACCGSWQFNESFQRLIKQVFPNAKLKRIPPDHEMFTTRVGYDVHRVRRRVRTSDNANAVLTTEVHEGEPFLEGIEIDGRYAVVYSKYDISCALERQSSVTCEGYIDDDAFKIAVNVVLYALLQDVRYYELVK